MYQSIVVGTDGSDTATEAVKRAAALAADWGAALHVVSAHTPHKAKVAVGAGPEAAQGGPRPDYQLAAVLERALPRAKTGAREPKIHAPKGDPADALMEVAEREGADLIVVGNRGM